MTIILKEDEKIYQQARQLSQSERDIVNAQIDEWERHISASHFRFCPLFSLKKDDSCGRCVDYRMLNTKIIREIIINTLDLKN